jgi:chemotaxis protein methyltransferase CheR
MEETVFREIAELARKGSGQHIPPTKSYLVDARLSAILRREGLSSVEDLVAILNARPDSKLSGEIAAALTSKRTRFFSERGTLERVVKLVLPELAKRARDGRIRIWCAGGSTGQEALSLAILIQEMGKNAFEDVQIEIVTTDICERTSASARSGIFGHFEIQKGLSARRMLAHFTRLDTSEWQVSHALASQIGVRTQNLMQSAEGLGMFDVILCRNVITDMTKDARIKALLNVGRQLSERGLLFLGETESAAGLIAGLEPSRAIRGGYSRNVDAGDLTVAA